MTDNDIIKALECCIPSYHKNCKECVYSKHKSHGISVKTCSEVMRIDLFNLINRRKSEIERLIAKYRHIDAEIPRFKAKAVKEFAEDVQEEISDAIHSNYNAKEEKENKCKKLGIPANLDGGFLQYCDGKIDALSGLASYIDNLVNEIVGNNNG